MKRATVVVAMIGLISLVMPAAESRRRVAVLDFDYATVQGDVAAIFGSNADVGKGVADLMVDQLVRSGRFAVIERKAIDKVLAEQNFSNSDRVDAATAAKLGRVLGVEAVIIGSITQFGRDDRSNSIGAGAWNHWAGRYGVGRVGVREAKAVVGLSARLVSTDTAEILAVASGKGESSRSGASLLGSGGSSWNFGGGAAEVTASRFGATILGEATREAAREVARQMEIHGARIPARTVRVEGLVADVSSDTLVLNVGAKAGVRAGDRLAIRRLTREIKDPATGQVIRRLFETVGECVVTEADEISAVAKFSGSAKLGDAALSAEP